MPRFAFTGCLLLVVLMATSGSALALQTDTTGGLSFSGQTILQSGREPVSELSSGAGDGRVTTVVKVLSDANSSNEVYSGGKERAVFRYRLDSASAPASRVQIVRLKDGRVVRSWPVRIGPDGEGVVSWNGSVRGKPQPTGRYEFRIVTSSSQALGRSLTGSRASDSLALAASDEFTLYEAIFPIRGKHDLRRSPNNGFGGARNHQGHDVFAECGTPLVAARGGQVTFKGYHSAAGNYIVVKRPDGGSDAYMHLQRPAQVRKNQRVYTGDPIGFVGQTGRASGCHLHFETWTAPGWYEGGRAVDPLPQLREWDSWS